MPAAKNIKELYLMANTLRQDVITLLAAAQSGHTAGALGMADIYAALFFSAMRYNPQRPESEDRDYLYLSNGHICPIHYAAMAEAGFFPRQELLTFRKLGSRLQGHPHNLSLPGIENSGGPLAQGLSQAAGCAKALKIDKKKNRVYCICSDGEHDEGQAWEAAMFAGNNKLDNLTLIMDRNNIQIDGFTNDVMDLEPLNEKYIAFNWHVIEIDGHDMHAILAALQEAKRTANKPTIIIAKTIPGKGVTFMQNKPEWHGKPPTQDEAAAALQELEEERASIERAT
ncbi:transketolase [Candidatus Woesearchaeota archaeon]|nr:MAG: transketolase [Candidatus Woesearchaeota archaeon]